MKNKILFMLIFGIVLFGIVSIISFNWEDSNLVSYYELKETSGAVVDSHGANNGTNVGATRGVTGKIGNAFSFDGSTESELVNFTGGNPIGNIGGGDFTINLWVKPQGTARMTIMALGFDATPPEDFINFYVDGNVFKTYSVTSGGSADYLALTGGNVPSNSWSMLTLRRTGNNITIFVDAVQVNTGTLNGEFVSTYFDYTYYLGRESSPGFPRWYNGTIDEVLISNKSLSTDEISELWNDGNGLAYGGGELLITLISPEDDLGISTVGENFTASYVSPSNLVNATYHVWDGEGTIFNQTTVAVTGVSNNTTLYIDAFTLGIYEWNVKVCDGYNCTFAENNFTLIVGATVNTESYNNYTYETSTETFEVNVSLLAGATLYDAQLSYNGTFYEGEITLISGSQYSVTTTIDIHTVNSSSELKEFFWQLIYPVGGGNFLYQNLTEHEQNVSQIQLGECSGGLTNVTLNFTNWDEENRTSIDPFDFHGTFHYWLGSGSVYKNFSLSNTNITNQSICILPSNLTYYADAQIQYEKVGYVKRNHYLINATLTNSTQHIKLFSLLTSVATTFILEVIDDAQFPVIGAYLYIQRYYPGTGTFETVAMAKTDITGSTVGHFEKETEDYKVIVFKDGAVLFESGAQKIFCRETPCTVTFQIEPAVGTVWNDFGDIPNLIWSLEFNETSNIWTYTYVDTSGTAQYGRLHVYYEKGSQRKVTICNTNSTSASATLTCNVTGYEEMGTIYAAGYISRSPEILVYLKTAMIRTIKTILGLEGLFLSMFVLLLLGLTGLWNPAVGIISVVAGMIILNFMGLASFGAVTIWGVIFIALIILWELKS